MTQIYADKSFPAFETELLTRMRCFKVHRIKCLHYPDSRSFASTARRCCVFLLLVFLVYSLPVSREKTRHLVNRKKNTIWQENGIKPPGISSRSENLFFNINFHRQQGLQNLKGRPSRAGLHLKLAPISIHHLSFCKYLPQCLAVVFLFLSAPVLLPAHRVGSSVLRDNQPGPT